MPQQQRVDYVPTGAHAAPRIGGAHLKPGELAGPGRRYGNLPGTCGAVVKAPAVEAVLDGGTGLAVMTMPETVLVAIARAVHLAHGSDGARAFARTATGDRQALQGLLANPAVREALTLTITAADVVELAQRLDHVDSELDDMLAEQAGPDPDAARDLVIDDALLDAGERPDL